MLKKERWIVYPLLMLSLFSSMIGIKVIQAQQEILDIVTTKELKVVDDEGRTVAQLRNDNGGASLILVGPQNTQNSLRLISDDISSRLQLAAGLGVIALSSNEDYGFLSIRYEQHETRLLGNKNEGHLHFNGRYPTRYLSLGGHADSGGYLYMDNESGNRSISLHQTVDGRGGLWVYDKYGKEAKSFTY